ncbi:MAG: 50S ribosomal protein L6 [Methanomicrobiales archaeon]|nr:50S ribosomal protein L6 [Methanomicrobiales archaeon]MDD1660132.1 50S ribosomal protein L6 [Methanomicrobiales archaeon]
MTIIRVVKIPEGVTVKLEGSTLAVKGPKGTLTRDMYFPGIQMAVQGRELSISTESERKKLLAMVGTFAAHVRNMCRGVTDGYQYRMKVVYSHFPIQLKMAGSTLEVHNFLGEKTTRFARVEPGVSVALGSDEVTLTGIDRETVGKTAANIEHATRIRNRDPRVFQDGVYIVERT